MSEELRLQLIDKMIQEASNLVEDNFIDIFVPIDQYLDELRQELNKLSITEILQFQHMLDETK